MLPSPIYLLLAISCKAAAAKLVSNVEERAAVSVALSHNQVSRRCFCSLSGPDFLSGRQPSANSDLVIPASTFQPSCQPAFISQMSLAIISLLIFDLIPARQQRPRGESQPPLCPHPPIGCVDVETFAFYGLYSSRNVWSAGDSVSQGTFSALRAALTRTAAPEH